MKETQTTEAVEFKSLEQFQTLKNQELMDILGGDGRYFTRMNNTLFGKKR